MALSDTNFKLTGPRLRAVELVAADDLTDDSIAAEVGVTKSTLAKWKRIPVFTEMVDDAKRKAAEAIRAEGIVNKQNRVDSYVADFALTNQIMAERAADAEIAEGPGGKTGLIVRTIKPVGSGDNFTTVEEFTFDAALLTARQNLRRQVAQELGEWTEKKEVSGPNGGPLEITEVEVVRSVPALTETSS